MAKSNCNIITPFRMLCLNNFPFIEEDFDAVDNYQLLSKIGGKLNEVIKNENNLNENFTNLYNAYLALKAYVDEYFDNLDIQEEIDAKLDEMADNGTLADIIAEYIELRGQLVYNTVAEMKDAENITDGSFLKTYGFYEYNDGGGALYRARPVTNEDVVDGMKLIALNDQSLVAELIIGEIINIRQFGAVCDGTTNDTTKIKACISSINENVKTVIFNNTNDLIINDEIDLSNLNGITFEFKGKIKRMSSPITAFCFKVWNSKNLTFNNSNIYSVRDQNETPPQDHTRVSPLGSCIIGYHISKSENITFNHVTFDKMMSDFYNQPYDGTYKSRNITINNWYSRDASLPLFMQYVDNVYIDNADVIPAVDMGGGDHFIYFSNYVDTVFITNSKFVNTDTNYGTAIQFYNTGSNASDASCPKNLTIDTCIFNICARVTTLRYSSNAKILNSDIYYMSNESTGYVDYAFTTFGSSYLEINNCSMKGYIHTLNTGETNSTVKITNSEITSLDSTPSNTIAYSGTTTPKLMFDNNIVKWDNGFFYSANSVTPNAIIKNNIFSQADATTAFLSMRKAEGGVLKFINNNVMYTGTPKANFFLIYNATSTPGQIDVYYNIIEGYTDIANATEIETINNNYNIV